VTNMKMEKIGNTPNTRIMVLAYLYYLAIILLPILQSYVSVYLQIFAVFVVTLTFLLRSYLNKYLVFILPFVTLILLQTVMWVNNNSNFEIQNLILLVYENFVVYIPMLVAYYLIETNNKEASKAIIKVIIIFTSVTLVSSIIGLHNIPMAARMIATPTTSYEELFSFRRMNIGGFAFVYTCLFFIPMLIASYKMKKIKFWHLFIGLGLISYYVVLTQYATAVLLLILSLVSLFFPKKIPIKKMVIILVVILITIILTRTYIANMLYYISGRSSYILQVKISAFADVIAGVENNTASLAIRQMVYEKSFNAFLKHPLFGSFLTNDNYVYGGHSFILDTLAQFGIFGLIILGLIYGSILKYLYLPFKKSPFFGYMVWTYLLCILLAIINPWENIFVIALAVPLSAYVLQE
jgi:oligosaccharide repeat unit polymerase